MTDRTDLFTCGIWTVKAGREDDFVAAWEDLARWSAERAGHLPPPRRRRRRLTPSRCAM